MTLNFCLLLNVIGIYLAAGSELLYEKSSTICSTCIFNGAVIFPVGGGVPGLMAHNMNLHPT